MSSLGDELTAALLKCNQSGQYVNKSSSFNNVEREVVDWGATVWISAVPATWRLSLVWLRSPVCRSTGVVEMYSLQLHHLPYQPTTQYLSNCNHNKKLKKKNSYMVDKK